MNVSSLSVTVLFLFTALTDGIKSSQTENIDIHFIEHLTFFASFDQGFEADIAMGDPGFYISDTWAGREQASSVVSGTEHVSIAEDEGRFGNALWIDNSYTPVYFYRGGQNIEYREEDWEGAVSFWLRVSPDEDLPEGFSDPVQLTTRAWNDGSLFVDFTDESPRIFRFAFFADREVWDPELRDWDDVPIEERPMVEVDGNLFSNTEWVHVAFSFTRFNSGTANGDVATYINGEYVETLSDREQTITWNPDEIAIWLGYNYRGYIDELAIFNKALQPDQIKAIYELEAGIGYLLNQ